MKIKFLIFLCFIVSSCLYEETSIERVNNELNSNHILVATVDGKLHFLNIIDGKEKWQSSINRPLVFSSSISLITKNSTNPPYSRIFTNIDGRLILEDSVKGFQVIFM